MRFALAILYLGLNFFVSLGAQEKPPFSVTTVPLFESVSVYVDYGKESPSKCEVLFKKKDANRWERAWPLYKAKADHQFRGSIVKLEEDVAYELSVELYDEAGVSLGKSINEFRTWNPNPPIARTVQLKSQGPLEVIDIHGSPDGWIKYTMDPEGVLDGGNTVEAAILIKNSSYVIFEGFTVKGGARHGFKLTASDNVRVQNCDISGWSRIGKQIFDKNLLGNRWPGPSAFYDEKLKAINSDSAVYIDGSKNIVVERCYAHDPRGRSNPWGELHIHPAGPEGIFVKSEGSIVIRYNDIIGSDAHRWNDGIEGWGNGEANGGFNHDADIYGNMFAFGDDDGTELDGGQKNVRFYRNKVEGFLCGVSTAPNIQGPSYIFENLVVNLSDEDGRFGAVIKSGGGSTYSKGMTYFFNNTFYTSGNGIAGVGFGEDKNRPLFFGLSRNNVLACNLPINDHIKDPGNSFDYDLLCNKTTLSGRYVVSFEGEEKHGVIALPSFKDASAADFNLASNSRGRGEGVEIPNFSQATTDGKVTMGAYHSLNDGWLPYRPIPVTCDKFQIALQGDLKKGQFGSEILTVKVLPKSQWSSKFKIAKNEAFNWLSVEPVAGRLEPNKPITFKVSLDQERVMAGLLKGLFLVRMESGYSIPITVYAKIKEANAFEKIFTLDSFLNNGLPMPEDDPKALSGKLIKFSGGNMTTSIEPNLQLNWDVPADGDYYLLIRQRATELPLGKHDSLFVSIDGELPRQINLSGSLDWKWSPLACGDPESKNIFAIHLKTGKHSIKMHPRESIYFDALMIRNNPLMDE